MANRQTIDMWLDDEFSDNDSNIDTDYAQLEAEFQNIGTYDVLDDNENVELIPSDHDEPMEVNQGAGDAYPNIRPRQRNRMAAPVMTWETMDGFVGSREMFNLNAGPNIPFENKLDIFEFFFIHN